jgi:hypothetical protein
VVADALGWPLARFDAHNWEAATDGHHLVELAQRRLAGADGEEQSGSSVRQAAWWLRNSRRVREFVSAPPPHLSFLDQQLRLVLQRQMAVTAVVVGLGVGSGRFGLGVVGGVASVTR